MKKFLIILGLLVVIFLTFGCSSSRKVPNLKYDYVYGHELSSKENTYRGYVIRENGKVYYGDWVKVDGKWKSSDFCCEKTYEVKGDLIYFQSIFGSSGEQYYLQVHEGYLMTFEGNQGDHFMFLTNIKISF